MRVLIVTGRLAEDSARRYTTGLDVDVDVRVLPVSVAAFITPEAAAESLTSVKGYDLILLPGTIRGDVTPVEEATGTPTYKGPSYTYELPLILPFLDRVELSKTESASKLLRGVKESLALKEIKEVDESWREVLREEGGFIIGGEGREVAVGSAFPMRVIAEIVNAPTLELDQIRKRAQYFKSEGADIIDIGMLANDPKPDMVGEIIDAVRSSVGLPVSIDTLDPSEIEVAVSAGVDLVLSVDAGNMEEVASYVRDVPVVVLPSNMREGVLPRGAEERFAAMFNNMLQAHELGIMRVIADLILEPALKPGLLESLKAYQLFRQADENTPVLFGLGNATELIDVDSTGVNGLLTALAAEVGADLLFIPEHSPKARGSVRETVTASRMMFLAGRKDTLPKDLGLDLLILKEKRWVEWPYDRSVEDATEVVSAKPDDDLEWDTAGWFRIEVDREEEAIVAIHYVAVGEPNLVVKGKDAREVYQTILRRGLVGKYDHAAYLGKELMKAELALKLGRSYLQDDPLF
ncbi:dihydropteroate synthase-like protein [Candidatus Bathyarchaeota archaeon]|nr:dihydropteroate synthase-like protein [Candidatus Bathyarchaeota archaeon]